MHRVVDRGQILQGFVTAVVKRPASDLPAETRHAKAPRRRGHFGVRLRTASRSVSWCCIHRRPRLSTAKMPTGGATTPTSRLTFSVSVSEPVTNKSSSGEESHLSALTWPRQPGRRRPVSSPTLGAPKPRPSSKCFTPSPSGATNIATNQKTAAHKSVYFQ